MTQSQTDIAALVAELRKAAYDKADLHNSTMPYGVDDMKPEDTLYWRAADALEAKAAPEVTEGGWRPIKTAPKDGQWFLAILQGELEPGTPFIPDVVKWGECALSGHTGVLCSSDAFGAQIFSDVPYTHWMPLPAPPAALQPEGKGR